MTNRGNRLRRPALSPDRGALGLALDRGPVLSDQTTPPGST
jgi:hypothetical protein